LALMKTVGEHVGTFPKRYKEKWKASKAWIDADPKIQTEVMPDGSPVFTFVFDEIRKFKADAMPVASPGHRASRNDGRPSRCDLRLAGRDQPLHQASMLTVLCGGNL
jgi:hypothetical protein